MSKLESNDLAETSRLLEAARELVRAAGDSVGRRPKNRLITEIYQRFMREMVSHPDLRFLTAKSFVSCQPLVRLAFGEAMATDMSRELVTEAQNRLFREGYKASTVKHRLGQMKTAWRWAIDKGLAYKPWCAPIARRGVKSKQGLRTKKRPYSVSELYRLLLAMPEPYRIPVSLIAEVGCRAGEAGAANVDDMRLDEHGLPWWHIHESKTGDGRIVPISLDTFETFTKTPGPLFLGCYGQRLSGNAMCHAVCKVLDRLKLRKLVHSGKKNVYDLDLHGLRRSWIHHARLANVPRVVRMYITGHEQTGTHDSYSRNAVLDHEARQAIEITRAWRRASIKAVECATPRRYNPAVGRRAGISRWTSSAPRGQELTKQVARNSWEALFGEGL